PPSPLFPYTTLFRSIEIARNGHEAIAQLDSIDDIDLVLMDIMMPEMDGFTAMQEIRKDPRFDKLPIIAVTAKAMKDDQERCLRADRKSTRLNSSHVK